LKIRSVVAKLFHANRQIGEHDEANSHFHNFYNIPKNEILQICQQ